MTTTGQDVADWLSKNVRVYAGWDRDRKFSPMTEGEVIAVITSPSLVVRDKHGHTQAWPVTLPIEEAE